MSQPDEQCCKAGESVMDAGRAEEISRVAKALSDPVRLRIFEHIAASDCSSVCACHLPDVFGIKQPTLSHHLSKLVDAGLVEREMRGRWAHFSIRQGGLAPLAEFFANKPECCTPGETC